MKNDTALNYISKLLNQVPEDWLRLTTHRLDIYNEAAAKTDFLSQFEALFLTKDTSGLHQLPTAYDYIRLGHPLSCVLEWTIAQEVGVSADQVISFSSQTIAIMAILRKNRLDKLPTRIISRQLPDCFDIDRLKNVYDYDFEWLQTNHPESLSPFEGSTIWVEQPDNISNFESYPNVDFCINFRPKVGSILLMQSKDSTAYVSAIQHVRRRETIAMTPVNCLAVLQEMVGQSAPNEYKAAYAQNKALVQQTLRDITHTTADPLLASSGLSIQYAIMMGLIDEAMQQHPGKAIRFIVPTNCYGGTNDQARRVAACLDPVRIVDLAVDGGSDMVSSLEPVLDQLALEDAIPYIIAEIPTNPRVEVPDMQSLLNTLAKPRQTADGKTAVQAVFILDQTFCPNLNMLGEGALLSDVPSIAYASGSKFPSAGKCTAGYCVANNKAANLLQTIERHLLLCDNAATLHQMAILAEQLPSMLERIEGAYQNTREFVNFIGETLPEANINFVSEELAAQGFTPSVFSMDLPTKGATDAEREAYKRQLNLKLINMIQAIPQESKFCVSYGQPKGCYWTVPATSTQGTTKEGDKDYIVRVSVSPELDFEKHKQVFNDFVRSL